jgi:hypothetical protein
VVQHKKGPYLAAKKDLMNALDQTADYVDDIALGDANIITLAGYAPTKGTSSSAPDPSQLTTVKLSRGVSGTLVSECENQTVIDDYICIMTTGEPLPKDVIISSAGQLMISPTEKPSTENAPLVADTPVTTLDFTKGRKKKFISLTPGTTYYFYFFGINAAGVGPLSTAVSIVCW